MIKAHLIAAARPNFMKVAPLYHAMFAQNWCEPIVVHTGQHYDVNMSDAFFTDLRLPEPHHHLGVGSGTHAEQTAGVMVAYEKLCMDERPDVTIVFGDVNSPIACALAAKKLGIPVTIVMPQTTPDIKVEAVGNWSPIRLCFLMRFFAVSLACAPFESQWPMRSCFRTRTFRLGM